MIDQLIVFGVLLGALVLFVWDRLRYDIVAALALLVLVVLGIIPAQDAFSGFGHPAVITVAALLIVTRALQNAGALEAVARLVERTPPTQVPRVLTLTGLVAGSSAFMNNIGACALFVPVAVQEAIKRGVPPSRVLMPVSFASLLGGLITLIGTPPNVIVATLREENLGAAFGMFDYTPVGLVVAVTGILYVSLIGWRFLPLKEKAETPVQQHFRIEDYIAEVRIPPSAPVVGRALATLEAAGRGDVAVVALIRGDERVLAPSSFVKLRADDVLIVEGEPELLSNLVNQTRLEFVGAADLSQEQLRSEDVSLVEVVVAPGSALEGRTAQGMRLHSRFAVNLLALARQGGTIQPRLGMTRFQVGDVLLLQGDKRALPDALTQLGCLPLAERPAPTPPPTNPLRLLAIFVAAVGLTGVGLVPVHVAFVLAVLGIVATGGLTLGRMYEAVDWPIIVLLGCFISVGEALQITGGTQLIAEQFLALGAGFPPWTILALLMVATMLLSDIINNAATAVLMAPVALTIGYQLGVSPDPFLMAVAVGASCTFLTPIGHQSNLLVMAPGGYRFGDYWRMGLALDVLIVAVAVPTILTVWPI